MGKVRERKVEAYVGCLASLLTRSVTRRLSCDSNPIPWWGVCLFSYSTVIFLILFLDELEYPVLCLMARNYLAIPATTCIAEL